MFSHFCRCCLSEFSNPADIVPLFERHKNIWYYRLISATFRLALTKDDNLGTNICKSCAVELLKSYKFRLKYVESDRKLRKMVKESEEANLASRSQYSDNGRLHSQRSTSDMVDSAGLSATNRNVPQNRWKCAYCPSEFGTGKLKLMHEGDEHSDNVSFREPAILIEDDDPMNDDLGSSDKANMNVNADQNEFRFMNRFMNQEPEVDLGLYLIGKHSQINSLDPLEINNFNDSSLLPPNVTSNSPETTINANDNKWKCRRCVAAFRTRDLLREHNHLHMVSKQQRPKQAVIKMKKIPNVTHGQPFTNERNVPKWQCKTCMLAFETRELLRIHRREYVARSEKDGLKSMQCKTVDNSESIKIKIEVVDE